MAVYTAAGVSGRVQRMASVPLPPTDAPPPGIGGAGLALWAYWHQLPRRELVPDRRDFDPMALRPHLPMTGLLEHEAPGLWRMRVIGTELSKRSGRKMTGTNYLDQLSERQRAAEDSRLAAALAQPCGVFGVRDVVHASRLVYRSHILRLPLRDNADRVRLLIAVSEEAKHSSAQALAGAPPVTLVDSRFVDIGGGVPDLDGAP
jgi:hypothetical protein